MPKILRLDDEEAFYRLNWLLHIAVNKELWNLIEQKDSFPGDLPEISLDAAGVDKLREISTIARQLAFHHEEKSRAAKK